MLRNYFVIAWRNLWKNRILSVIKIAGLSIGLTVCMLILLFSKDEISYDRFHAKKNNIFRIRLTMQINEDAPHTLGITQPPLGEAFKAEIPEVQECIRVVELPVTVKSKNDVFPENPIAVDSPFFTSFSFALLKGNPSTVLNDIYSIVLSQNAAKKYFGDDDPMGKVIELKINDEFLGFTVTGVAENAPENSTIKYEMILPFSFYKKNQSRGGWIGGSVNTFLVLQSHTNTQTVADKMQDIFDRNTREQIILAEKEQGIKAKLSLGLQPLTDIHLNRDLGPANGLVNGSSPLYSYVLTCIAIFILIIACINFINLSIAQSLKRAREIGIRKVVGGNRKQLIWQFLTESFLISLLAFTLAILITASILPAFNELANKKLSLSYLSDGWLYLSYFLLLVVTALTAGFYPSLVLSGFQPLKVLTGRQKLMGKNYFSKSLVVFQFALAIFLVMGTFAIYSQLNFLFRQPLGYDSKNLVKIDLPFSKQNNQAVARFKTALANEPTIETISARNMGSVGTAVWAEGKQVVIDYNKVDENFFNAFKIPFKEGRNFSPDFPGDTVQSVIVNEAFLREAGWDKISAIGKIIRYMEKERSSAIVGVIRDYHFRSLKEKITPQVFSLEPEEPFGQIWIKVKPGKIPQTLFTLANTYKKLAPFFPYSYQFMDDIIARNYDSETRWKRIISISAILFLFISCIGLLGLVILSVEQRTKEIGVRKVLGAAVSGIVVLISKEFTKLILGAFIIATPAAWWAIERWLQDFPYRIGVHWWLFVFAGITILALAWLSICFHAIRAAMSNPATALRSE